MKLKYIIRMTWLIGALAVAQSALAYTDDKPEEFCKDPKFKGFNLPTYNATDKVEVPPEAELNFTVSGWADPETIVVTAKKQPLDLTIENKMIFYRIKATLPPSLNGKFVRVNASAKAVLGCKGEAGWLLKIAAADSGAKTAEKAIEEKTEQAASLEQKAEPTDQETGVKAAE
ncbi:MAG: hypothetical protein ACU83N_02480 [Gammaproteobacteria bacterium]